MQYRSDIDGLRAVAVVPVILFHLGLTKISGLPMAPGGYIGVDIFFVISGFLISKILYSEITSGTYDIINFYNRRIKRIFPALMCVYLACLVASIFMQVPAESAEVGKAVSASILFVSNIFFASKDSYFDVNTQSNPLLHTWSLSVEEQFYIIFPLILYILKPFSSRVRITILIVFSCISFSWSEYLIYTNPTDSFYLVQSRAWELALGALLAISAPKSLWGDRPQRARIFNEGLGLFGLFAIIASVVGFGPDTPFPGAMALLPCAGAVAIIYSGGNDTTIVSRILSIKPIRFTGLISYSLYIWHWPLIVFFKSIHGMSKLDAIAVFGLCFVIAALSWRFIEQPFRRIKPTRAKLHVIIPTICIMAIMTCAAMALGPLSRLYWHPDERTEYLSQYMLNYDSSTTMRVGTCFLTSQYNDFSAYRSDLCLRQAPGRENVLLFGDSHSAQLWLGFKNVYPQINFLQASASGCLPVLEAKGEPRCKRLTNYIMHEYLPTHHVDAIVYAARWKSVQDAINGAKYLTQFTNRVYILGPNVEYDMSLPRLLVRAELTNNPQTPYRHMAVYNRAMDETFRNTPMPSRVTYLSIYRAICSPSCLTIAPDGNPMNFDDNHLSLSGSTYFAERIQNQFERKYPL